MSGESLARHEHSGFSANSRESSHLKAGGGVRFLFLLGLLSDMEVLETVLKRGADQQIQITRF